MKRTPANYDWYVMADPGTSGSAFAVLFIAVDTYRPFVFFLDEIYEKEVEKTVTPYTGPLIVEKCLQLNPNIESWRGYYDSAGAWFAAHFRKDPATANSGLKFAPVEKRPGEKEEGLDTLNALFINNSIAISQKCANTIWEYDNYCRDKNGKLPKRNDHQIDNGRYFIKMAGIIVGLSKTRPISLSRRSAKNTRDFTTKKAKGNEGRLNLFSRTLRTYGEDYE